MNALQKFIAELPRGDRPEFRRKLARALGVTEVAVRHMANGTRQINARHVLKIERETGITRHDLRPDLYPIENRLQ